MTYNVHKLYEKTKSLEDMKKRLIKHKFLNISRLSLKIYIYVKYSMFVKFFNRWTEVNYSKTLKVITDKVKKKNRWKKVNKCTVKSQK